MNTNPRSNFKRVRIALPLLLTGFVICFGAGMLPTSPAFGQAYNITVTGESYHAQVNDHYCASATIEMMLDCTAVRTTNAYINTFLTAADPAPSAALVPAQPTYVAGQVTFAPQVAIYNLLHNTAAQIAFNGGTYYTPIAGPNTGVPLSYSSPFSPWPTSGSGTNAIQFGLNVLDNPNVGGNGNHAYTAFNVPPTVAWGDYASRTIANAIKDYNVPAQVGIGSGAHSIAVTGVTGTGTPGRNQNYSISGFYVNDPWTGYAISQNLPRNQWGLGRHAWLRYGYQQVPLAFGGGIAPNRWFQNFNPAPGQAGEGAYMTGLGYKFVVEPLGPEAIDDGNGGLDSSLFTDALLPTPLSSTTIGAQAAGDLAGSDLNSEFGLSGGTLDTADEVPLSSGNEGDWLVPYEHGTDVTGALLINSLTGQIEEAMWLDATDPSMPLSDWVNMETGLENGFVPNDNVSLPEPSSLMLAIAGAVSFLLVSLTKRKRTTAA